MSQKTIQNFCRVFISVIQTASWDPDQGQILVWLFSDPYSVFFFCPGQYYKKLHLSGLQSSSVCAGLASAIHWYKECIK